MANLLLVGTQVAIDAESEMKGMGVIVGYAVLQHDVLAVVRLNEHYRGYVDNGMADDYKLYITHIVVNTERLTAIVSA